MNICIIPARGGSKRIKRKNVRDFCGKPMIAWSIEAALQSHLFANVIVSTDCLEIADVARQNGALVPFQRPAELSDDYCATIPVIRHAIEWLSKNQQRPKSVCCLYATAPFVQTDDLKRGFDTLTSDAGLDFAFSVTSFGFPIFRGLKIENNRVEMFWPEHECTRSQDLTPAYHDAGQFYWGSANAFCDRSGFFSANSAPVILPPGRVQDIDTPEDWNRAELMFQMQQSGIEKLRV